MSERVARLGRLTAHARRLALYLVIPALSAISPLIAIPAITSRFGAGGWATAAIAISIGSTAAVVCDLGWGTIGPQRIARDPSSALEIYRVALGSKVLVLLAIAPVSALIAVLLIDASPITGVLLTLGTLLASLSPSWFFIGQGRPGLILWTDTVPRIVLSSSAALAIALGAPLIVYGCGTLVASLSVMALGARGGGLPVLPSRAHLRSGVLVIREQLPLILGNVVSTLFTSAPASILANSSGPSVIATYSAVDRPMRMGLNVLGGVPARLQSWVGTPDPLEARRRSRVSIVINLVLGVVAFVGFFAVAPTVGRILFSGSITITPGLAALGGLLAFEICFSRGLGLALVAADRANHISVAVYVGAVVGVSLLLILPPVAGAAGALAAIIAAEAAMIVVQIVQLRLAWSSRSGTTRPPRIAVARPGSSAELREGA